MIHMRLKNIENITYNFKGYNRESIVQCMGY